MPKGWPKSGEVNLIPWYVESWELLCIIVPSVSWKAGAPHYEEEFCLVLTYVYRNFLSSQDLTRPFLKASGHSQMLLQHRRWQREKTLGEGSSGEHSVTFQSTSEKINSQVQGHESLSSLGWKGLWIALDPVLCWNYCIILYFVHVDLNMHIKNIRHALKLPLPEIQKLRLTCSCFSIFSWDVIMKYQN